MLRSAPVDSAADLPALPPLRDGNNPIERKAVYRAQLEIRSMPASLVVQIALWPDKLADWAKEMAIAPSVVYNMLANVKPYHRVRTLLARRLNVPKRCLDHLIEAVRPEPLARVPPDPPAEFAPAVPPPTYPAVEPAAAAQPGRGASPPTSRSSRGRRTSRPASQIPLNL